MKKNKIIGVHFLLFIVFSVIFFFSSEELLNIVASGSHNVEMWITLVTYGVVFIFIVMLISCLIFLRKSKNVLEKK